MTEFEKEVCDLLVEALMLGPLPGGFTAESDLFPALGLDSVDALEVVMAVRRRYGVEFNEQDEDNKAVFATLRALAAFIQTQRDQAA